VTLKIAQEPGDSADAVALLRARDEENFKLYSPEERFAVPLDKHVDGRLLFFVAREDSRPVGCGALQRHEDYSEMKSVFLLPSARGRRLGQEIIRTLEDAARGLGYEEVRLETGIRSPWAMKTYERAGYQRCERFGDYPVVETSIYMSKRLPPLQDGQTDVAIAPLADTTERNQTNEGAQP
jgi:GNAT superfamily N-acetyltransferase